MGIYRSEVASIRRGELSYGSWVGENTFEEMTAFYDRVNAWCDKHCIILGEGRVEVYPIDHPHFENKFWLFAPVVSGPEDIVENLSVTI